MNDFDTPPSLFARHSASSTALAAILDLDAGLNEVMIEVRHAELRTALPYALNLDAGVHAIVPAIEEELDIDLELEKSDPDPPSPSGRRPVNGLPANNAMDQRFRGGKRKVRGRGAQLLMALDVPDRLNTRTSPAYDVVAAIFAIRITQATMRDLLASLSAGSSPQSSEQMRNQISRIGENLDLAVAHLNAVDIDTYPTSRQNLLQGRNQLVALSKAHDTQGLSSLRPCSTAAPYLENLLLTLADCADDDLLPTITTLLGPSNPLKGILWEDLRSAKTHYHSAQGLYDDLAQARNDFTAVNLQNVDLVGLSLEGIRWSATTVWPSEYWKTEALLSSIELKQPGVYEIRGELSTHTY